MSEEKIKEYIIISDYSATDVVEAVNQYISDGWEPQGGLAITKDTQLGRMAYAQAMIKRYETI